VFAQGTRAHRHIEFDLRPGQAPDVVLEALSALRQPSVTAGGANIVVGFGPRLWSQLVGTAAPVAEFPEIEGVPSTPHDLWIWTHGTGDDVLFDIALAIKAQLDPVAVVVSEVAGFVYHDSRDLTGFIDGTENPAVEEAYEVATIDDGRPGAGGSFALAQRWIHDLAGFHALEEREQEGIIGRTKRDSTELADDVKPETAHIARVVIEDDNGDELEIYRRSVPYGTATEHGLFFVAFSADPERFSKMLGRMFGASGDSVRDRLTDFTRPVSGAYYFVPSLGQLGETLG
jgi:putative iron-dependent peroxidase